MVQLSSEYGVHANQIGQWRQRLLDEVPHVFSDRRRKQDKEDEEKRWSGFLGQETGIYKWETASGLWSCRRLSLR